MELWDFSVEINHMTNYTDTEIIAGLRSALQIYADPANWKNDGRGVQFIKDYKSNIFINDEDINMDDCSGYHRIHGEIARQALNKFCRSTKSVQESKVALPNHCNRHKDCNKSEELAGKKLFHCYDSCCEDCFGC